VAYSAYPPTVTNTITGVALPAVVAAIKATSTTLTSWTTTFALGDILFVNVNSSTSFKSVKLIISYTG
jgi:hypothetical protein